MTAVAIATDSGKVAVADDAKGKELLTAVGKTVEAIGTETTAADGSKTLAVKSFKVVEEAAAPKK